MKKNDKTKLRAVSNPEKPPIMSDLMVYPDFGHGFAPRAIHWEKDKVFGKEKNRKNAKRQNLNILEKKGLIPVRGLMRWQGFFEASGPDGHESEEPSHQAWYRWKDARRHLWMKDNSGSVIQDGYVTKAMPMDKEDIPEEMAELISGKAYGDWLAWKISEFCIESGLRGISVADHYDSIPHTSTRKADYNERTIDAFEKKYEVEIKGETPEERAEFIQDPKNKLFPLWNDFMCEAYTNFWATTLERISKETGDPVGFKMQIVYSPTDSRFHAVDLRQIEQRIGSVAAWTFISAELQGDWVRDLQKINVQSPRLGLHASKAPGIQISMIQSTPKEWPPEFDVGDAHPFWTSVKNTSPDLNEEEMVEYGVKYLKQAWLGSGWVHVANRDGSVRRAVQAVQRHYWDGGKLPDEIWNLFQEIRPERPFGPAVYYSVPVERSYEIEMEAWDLFDRVMSESGQNFTPGYYVSDAALNNINENSAPTAWITRDFERMSREEQKKLEALAPVYDTDDWDQIPSPLKFSEGVTGFGFIDQNNRVIIIASRTDDLNNENRNISIKFSLSEDLTGKYSAVDLFGYNDILNTYEETEFELEITEGEGELLFSMERWDTRVFKVDLPVGASLLRKKD